MYGHIAIKMFVNTRNTARLIRSLKKQLYYRIAFNGRLLSHSNFNHSTSETTIIDISNMKHCKRRYTMAYYNELFIFY